MGLGGGHCLVTRAYGAREGNPDRRPLGDSEAEGDSETEGETKCATVRVTEREGIESSTRGASAHSLSSVFFRRGT